MSLEGALVTILFDHLHSDSLVALRTGYRDLKSLNPY